jgi:hypothetical protein
MHISNGVVYEYNGGNPSGHALTTIYNSLCNLILIFCCAEHVRRVEDYDFSPEYIFDNARALTFGDDNMIAYRKLLFKCLEQQSLTKYMKLLFNLDYTNENKDDTIVSGRSIEEISFLKRGFRFDHGWKCPLELSVILETMNWQKKNSNQKELEERLEGVLRELALHGKKVYDQYAPKFLIASIEAYDYHCVGATYSMALASAYGLAI